MAALAVEPTRQNPTRTGLNAVAVLLAAMFATWLLGELIPAVVTRNNPCSGYETWEFASRGLSLRKIRLLGGMQ